MIEEGFYDGMAMEMLSKWNRRRAFTGHGSSVGFHHEEIFRETLRTMLSTRFGIRSGFVFTAKDNVSRQGDILIVDEAYPTPYVFRHGDLVVARPEAVAAVIEVKTRLSRRTFGEALENLASFQDVADRGAPKHHPATFAFAFAGPSLTPKRLETWYLRASLPHVVKNYPTALIVLGRGVVRFVGSPGFEKSGAFGHGVLVDATGAPISRARALAHFLAAIRSKIHIRAGVPCDAYEDTPLDGVHLSAGALRFGTGFDQTVRTAEPAPAPSASSQ